MGTTIITKNGSGAPAADDLVAGELAVDLTNKRLYTKDSGNNILELGSSPSTIVFSSVASNITPSADDTYDLGATGTRWRDIYIDGTAYLDAINFNGTAITATAAELNILDGVTSTAAELNILDGVTSTAAELNILDGVTATTAELNILDGVTSTTAELNILDGVTSTTAELNILDGVTATATELNYVDGVTSAIQTQLDAKAPTASPTLTGTITAADLIISNRQIATDDASGTNTAGNNVTLKAGSSTGSAAGGSLIFQTTPAGLTGTSVNSFSTVMTLDESGIDVAGAVEFDSLSGTGSVSVTDILDQDDMSSDSATALATQQSIKAYVDSQIGSNNELSEVLAIGNTTGSTNIVVTAGQSITTDTIAETTAAAGVTVDSLLIKDGGITAAGTSTFAGQTISDLGTVTTANIDGGSIDGTTIGASTAAAGTFTTGQFDTSLNVDGTVTADGLTVDGSGGFGLTAPTISEGFQIHVDEAGNGVWGGFGNVYLTSNYKFNSTNKFAGTGYAQILEAVPSTGAFTFKTSSASGTADATATMQNRLNIATNGDISFYEDTGTTAKLFWDASAESLGIGTTSPNAALDVLGSSGDQLRLRTAETEEYKIGRNSSTGFLDLYGTQTGYTGYTFGGVDGERMRIDSSGNVGIGTSSPSVQLHLQDGASEDVSGSTIRMDLSGINPYWEIQARNGGNSANRKLHFYTNSGSDEVLTLTQAGNVGIGTTSPSQPLTVEAAAGYLVTAQENSANKVRFQAYADTTQVALVSGYDTTAKPMTFFTGGSEAMQIDTSGNLLVGKDANDNTTNGFVLDANGTLNIVRSSEYLMRLNRTSTDGEILRFQKDGSTVGSIATVSNRLAIGSNDVGLFFDSTNERFTPIDQTNLVDRDDAIDLGYASSRFKDLYLSGGIYVDGDGSSRTEISSSTVSSVVYQDLGGFTGTPSVARGIRFLCNDASTAKAERMRLDKDGNLLVGKTSTLLADVGHNFSPSGFSFHTRDGGAVAYFNRETSDGDIALFYKDGASVGSVGATGGDLFIGTGDAGLWFQDSGNAIRPFRVDTQVGHDASIDLGHSSNRFKDLYRSGSTISTSDRNMKQDERDLTEAETRVAQACKGLLKAFRFIDAVEVDGDDARIHFGIIAQDLQAAFEAEGLDATKYAMFRPSTFTDDEGNEQTRLGVCYENLLAFIIAAI